MSQPTLSTQVRKLEEELGVQLVERAPRKVMLTPVGEEVAQRARNVLNEIEQLRMVARKNINPAEGTLRLGIFPTLAPYLLPHVIPTIRKSFPSLTLQLAEEKSEEILKMLHHGTLDAALLALPIEDHGLQITELFEEPFVLAVPGQHSLANKSSVTIEDLRGSELLLLEEGHCMREHALEVCSLAGAGERVDFYATSMETLRQMVAANVGITLLPLLAVQPPIAKTANVVIKPFASPYPSRTIALVWRKTSALSEFFESLAKPLGDLPKSLLEPS